MEQPSVSDPQFVHFQHCCPTLSREEQVVLFHALCNRGISFASNGTVTITNSVINAPVASINFGTMLSIIQMLPEPLDPLPAALAALTSIPLNDVPTPRSDLPQASRLPFEASPYFVGRLADLKALAQAIGTAQPAVVMPAVASGLGGIGKTSLVTEFAYRYGVYFHGGVFWLNCADPDQVANQIAACAVDLCINPTGMAFDEQVQRVLNAWKSPMPRLLIFDNCEDPAILAQWKPTVGGCRVLITARSGQWPTLTQIRLGVLSPAESRSLLQRLCTRLTNTEANAIAEDVGYLPLALHLAGSYLAAYPHHTVEQYRKDLTISHRSLKGRGALPSPTRHEPDVEATFMLSFNRLNPNHMLDALALGMLAGAAWCAPGVPIPRELVLAFRPEGTDADDGVDALRRLQQLGLLDGMDAVVLHRLLAQVVQLRIGLTEMLVVIEDRIVDMATHINSTYLPKKMQPLEPHLRFVTMRAWNRGDQRTAHLIHSLGFFEDLCGSYRFAQQLFEYAWALRKDLLGIDHPATAESIDGVAGVLSRQGKYREAQPLYEQALAIRTATLGIDHSATAESVNNLAFVLSRQGKYREAQPLYEQALAIRTVTLGINHPATATSMNNLAGLLLKQDFYREAQPLYEQALAIRTATLGIEHPATARSVNNLASVLEKQGRYTEAQPLYEEALIARETRLGKKHPSTATSMIGLASVLERQGKYAEAQPLYEEALKIYEAVFGADHPDIAVSMIGLASVSERQGKYAEAQPLYEEALKIYEAVFGTDHPDTEQTRKNLNSLKMVLDSIKMSP
ncbi:tetratricopeptide repeat protein [Herpetosiphon llansteffanensis]|uniref:tetratricopeptide repeat protein n=1 Tax=Herpetosiphon llansteffanensis TaxID=2094568 RepID=UPI0013E05818|nr:tetratricopeptide repeat protein [Herpetosiphon llansteffanensis]